MLGNTTFTKSLNQTKAAENTAYEMQDVPLLDMQDECFPSLILETFKNIGFVMIQNHGISNEEIDEAFSKSREMFRLPVEEKKPFVADRNRGYSGPGQELLDEKDKNNDKKQVFDLGHPDGPN